MTTWTSDELKKIEAAEELELVSVRLDGTLRDSVTIWVVRVGADLYVRSANGRTGSWFRATQVRHEGHIEAGGVHARNERRRPSLRLPDNRRAG